MAFTSSTATPVPSSVLHAVLFLTCPLSRTLDASTLHSLQLILTSTLRAAYLPSATPRLMLTLSPSALPPRPIYAACIAAGVLWTEWIAALGAQDMDLLIIPQTVLVRIGGEVHTVWRDAPAPVPVVRVTEPQVPISKLALGTPISKLALTQEQKPQVHDLRATVTSAIVRRRTLAQQLLESDEEEDEEIFAMISKERFIVSPTPTRERFVVPAIPSRGLAAAAAGLDTVPSPTSSPEPPSSEDESASTSSRSSSPFSEASFFSEDSLTSASSISSVPSKVAAPMRIALPTLSPPARPRAPGPFSRLAAIPTTEQKPTTLRRDRAPKIYIDLSKRDVTKYLYEGGKSTVLTGGVMLGGPAPKAPAPKAVKVEEKKYRAPIGRAATGSWRRV